MSSRLSSNLFASVLAQLLRYGAPLAFYPFLTRSLGAGAFATFALAFTTAVMLGQVIEFGYGMSGVRSLAEAQKDPVAAQAVVGEIIVGRSVTLLFTAAAAAAILPWLPRSISGDPGLLAATALLSVAYGLSGTWYLIGRERAAELARLEVLVSFAQLGLLLAFIKTHASPWLAVTLMAVPVCAAAAYIHFLALRELGVVWPKRERVVASLHESFRFFCFTGLMPIFNRANLLVLGALSTPIEVAYYAVGERIVTAAANTSLPFVRVIQPRITLLIATNRSAARRLFQRTFAGLVALMSLGSVVGATLSPWVVPLVFGTKLAAAWPVVALQLFLVPVMLASRLLGTLALVPLHHERLYQRIVLFSGATSLVFAPGIVHLGSSLGLASWRVFVELATAIACVLAFLSKGGFQRDHMVTGASFGVPAAEEEALCSGKT